MGQQPNLGLYRKFLVLTITAVCLLILVGGVVRSTGSGMGCPDWPKCFGNWVPPTDEQELPNNYKDVYAQKRHQKNLRLANYLESFGFEELVDRLRNDQSILVEETFNPTKTWTEYLNRLLGVLIGFLFIVNVFFAFLNRKSNPKLLGLVILNLVIVIFQGWVGSIVVSTNLLVGMISFHMILALLILALLIYNYWLIKEPEEINSTNTGLVDRAVILIFIALILFTVQVVFGTQVRESIDSIASRLGQAARSVWVSELGLSFYIHRSFSIVILAAHGYFAFVVYRLFGQEPIIRFVYVLVGLLIVEVLTGTLMAYFAIPPVFQPIHLLLATLIFGVDFYLLLQLTALRNSKQVELIGNPE